MITMLSTWRHSGFHVFCGNRILPKEESAMENLARYIIQASFSQERMQYLADEGTVIYSAKDGALRQQIREDLQKRSLEKRAVAPHEVAHGFIFFPREAKKPKELRLSIRATDTEKIYPLIMKF